MAAVFTSTGYHLELIDGQELQKPLPKKLHALVQMRLAIQLSQWQGQLNVRVMTELAVLCGNQHDARIVPDIVVARRGATYKDGMLAQGAELAVEIMTAGQTFSDLLSKCEHLHSGGTTYCCILWPEKRSAWHYFADGTLEHVTDTLAAGPIQLQVAPLFEDLEDEP